MLCQYRKKISCLQETSVTEFEKILGTVVHGGRLAGALLPVQQRVAFLQNQV